MAQRDPESQEKKLYSNSWCDFPRPESFRETKGEDRVLRRSLDLNLKSDGVLGSYGAG